MQSINRNYISTALVSGLFLTLVVAALVSEFFQAPVITSKELSNLQYLFSDQQIEKVDGVSLKSNLGNFDLEKNNTQWILTKPRRINANEQIINRLMESLKNIKIKKIFPKDPINVSNFSLDNPTSTIVLQSQGEDIETISFGLINPIDNSTYIVSDRDNAIYHVNSVKFSIEKLDFSSLVDSRVFSTPISEISGVTVINNSKIRFKFNKKEDQWISGNKVLNEERVRDFLTKLSSFKSVFILDKRTEKMNAAINRYLEKPYFKVILNTRNHGDIEYDISWVLNSLPNIKIEKKANFIIRASNREHPFLVNKEYLNILYKRLSSFRPSPLNKIIY